MALVLCMNFNGKMVMPTNESIIAVPINVEQAGQTRQFLVRLVEKLDIVLGYRGDDPYVKLSDLQTNTSTIDSNLTQLEQTILNVITGLLNENSEVVTQLINALTEATNQAIEDLKSSTTVNDADDSTQTVSNPPTQTEVQNIQDQVVDVATQLNELLAALRATEIIAT